MFFTILRGQEKLLTAMREDTMRLKASMMQVEARLRALQGVPEEASAAAALYDGYDMAEQDAAPAHLVTAAPPAGVSVQAGDAVSAPVTTSVPPDVIRWDAPQERATPAWQEGSSAPHAGRTSLSLDSLSMEPPAETASASVRDGGLDLHFDHLTPPRR